MVLVLVMQSVATKAPFASFLTLLWLPVYILVFDSLTLQAPLAKLQFRTQLGSWKGEPVAMLLEGTSQDFRDLGLHECSHVTRGDIPGLPWPGTTMLPEGTSQEVLRWHEYSHVTRRDIPGLPRPGTTMLPEGTSQEVLRWHEYSHVTRRDIPGLPRPGTTRV